MGTLPVTGVWAQILSWMTVSLPDASQRFVFETAIGLTRGHRSFLSFGMLGTLWAASAGIMNMMGSLNVVYEARETRGWIKRMLIALLMVVVLAFFFVISFALLSVGDFVGKHLATRFGDIFASAWHVSRWVVSLVLLAAGIAFINNILPNVKRRWRWMTPGTVFAVLAWVGATQSFNLYVRYVASYDKTYGALGAFVILMVWIYLISLITLVGAEIDAEIWKMRAPARPAESTQIAPGAYPVSQIVPPEQEAQQRPRVTAEKEELSEHS